MSNLGGVIEVPWIRQPVGPVSIDWSKPITRDLIYATQVYDGCRDLVRSTRATAGTGTPTNAISPKGRAGGFVSASSQYWIPANYPGGSLTAVTTYPATAAFIGRCSAISDGSNGYIAYSLIWSNSNACTPIFGAFSGAWIVDQNAATGGAFGWTGQDTGLHHFVVIHGNGFSGVRPILYLDGKLMTESAQTSWGVPAVGNFSVGARHNGASLRPWSGTLQDLWVWKRQLSDVECRSLYANHWQFLKGYA